MQLQIRTDWYLDYLWEVHHSGLSEEAKKMLYEMLSDFEWEYIEQRVIVESN